MGAYSKNVAASALLMAMGLGLCASPLFSQTATKTVAKAPTAATYRAPRTADGKLDAGAIPTRPGSDEL